MPAPQDPDQPAPGLPTWSRLKPLDLWRWPLPELPSATDRLLARLAGLLALGALGDVQGWERAQPRQDPFLLVANHSTRREAILLPAILFLARGGRPVRFLADWNFRLIPGLGLLYDRSGTITLTRKDARPRFLNHLRSRFTPSLPAHVEARHHLLQGGAVGIFPEGTVNRDANRLLYGRRGAARLSLETGVPVIPVGIRFARWDPRGTPVDRTSSLNIRFGEALRPPIPPSRPASLQDVSDWHGELMAAIAGLCGKEWCGTRGRPATRRVGGLAPSGFTAHRRGDSPC